MRLAATIRVLLFGVMCCGIAGGCDLGGGDESFNVPPERLVAMTAVYEDTLPVGGQFINWFWPTSKSPQTMK